MIIIIINYFLLNFIFKKNQNAVNLDSENQDAQNLLNEINSLDEIK